jgi:hypothetical protein
VRAIALVVLAALTLSFVAGLGLPRFEVDHSDCYWGAGPWPYVACSPETAYAEVRKQFYSLWLVVLYGPVFALALIENPTRILGDFPGSLALSLFIHGCLGFLLWDFCRLVMRR